MKTLITILALAIAIPSFANEQAVIRALCDSGKVEGHYAPTLGKIGKVDLYLVCIGNERIAATFTQGTSLHNTMVFSAVDGDKLTFASYKLSFDESGELPAEGEPAMRMQLHIPQLMNGVAHGRFRTVRLKESFIFKVSRDKGFPNVLALGDNSRDYSRDIVGLFSVASMPGTKFDMPVIVDLDFYGGQQRVGFVDPMGNSIAMLMGMHSGKSNVFYAATGTELGTLPLVHVRGRVMGPDTIEFYYFNTMLGMLGPFTGQRTERLPFIRR